MSANDNKSPLIQANHNLFYETSIDKSGSSDFANPLPVLRPTYPPLEIAPELMDQSLPQRNPLHVIPSAGVMVQNEAIMQPSVDDYIKTADEMSTYLTWGIPDIPQWLNLPDQMPPGWEIGQLILPMEITWILALGHCYIPTSAYSRWSLRCGLKARSRHATHYVLNNEHTRRLRSTKSKTASPASSN